MIELILLTFSFDECFAHENRQNGAKHFDDVVRGLLQDLRVVKRTVMQLTQP